MMYYCRKCEIKLPFIFPLYVCPRCKSPLLITYDFKNVEKEFRYEIENYRSMWSLRSLLPDVKVCVSLGESQTPFRKALRIGKYLGFSNLFIKDESRNPTGSFIDRGSSVLVSLLKTYNYENIVVERGGNLAASITAYASVVDLNVYVKDLRPYDIIKVYQILSYGARLVSNEDLVESLKMKYYVTAGDPLLIEGYKTIYFEIFRELKYNHPDVVIAPLGSGSLVTSLWKAINELFLLGYGNKKPRIYGVQSISWDPIVKMLKGEDIKGKPSYDTLASDLIFENPPRAHDAINAIRQSKGNAISVSDNEIIDSMKLLAKYEGLLVEPSAATTLAGLIKLRDSGEVDSDEKIVVIVTGSGLKGITGLIRRILRHTITLEGEELLKIGRVKREILKIISNYGEIYGYQIWKNLNSQGFNLTKAAIYKHLTELEHLGLIKRRVSHDRRVYYSLTSEGRRVINLIRLHEI